MLENVNEGTSARVAHGKDMGAQLDGENAATDIYFNGESFWK